MVGKDAPAGFRDFTRTRPAYLENRGRRRQGDQPSRYLERSGASEGVDDRFEVIERLSGVVAAHHETLAEPQAAVRYLAEKLVVDDAAVVGEHVAASERPLEPLPALLARKLDEVDVGVGRKHSTRRARGTSSSVSTPPPRC